MHLLLGIPRILISLIALGIRLAPLILVIIAVVWFYRRSQGGGTHQEPPSEPHFDGPVHTVDWREAEDDTDHTEEGDAP